VHFFTQIGAVNFIVFSENRLLSSTHEFILMSGVVLIRARSKVWCGHSSLRGVRGVGVPWAADSRGLGAE
jgi:hypothetical protein